MNAPVIFINIIARFLLHSLYILDTATAFSMKHWHIEKTVFIISIINALCG